MITCKTVLFYAFVFYTATYFHVGNSDNATGVDCDKGETYNVSTTGGKVYRDNLESLLEVLASNASHPNGFYNYTAGSGTDAAANGLFLCRGDISEADCYSCLADAKPAILQMCTNNTRATLWYDKCMLRFSNKDIFSLLDGRRFTWYIWMNQNVSDGSLLNRVLGTTFDQIAKTAARGNDSGKKFAVKEADFQEFQKIFTLGQCTPDLSNLDCETCLRDAIRLIPSCCSNRVGGSVINPSCNIRYDTSPFYESLAATPPISGLGSINQDDGRMSMTTIVAIAIPAAVAFVAFAAVLFCAVRRANNKRRHDSSTDHGDSISTDAEFLRYSFSQVQAFTNNFDVENMIGQGGFGSVYKGLLPNGLTVAMKRLSRSSTQGVKEFINEISLVAKLQHKNLVRLLGYCLEGEEKILIYEFVTNKSLDYSLFGTEKQTLLDWSKRYTIIGGIARGLLYLHEDSRIKIIHRDLKAGNVLLDQNMNAKIADFGMARLFGIDQSHGSTSNIAGTFGYMAPEYMFQGILSVKSDVFSFGVLILEIISGKKISNTTCFGSDHLLTYAWKNWRNGTPLALMDPALKDSYDINEVIRCVHIGLLCVAEDAEQRPTMASVVLMLNSYSTPLSAPNPPAFFGQNKTGSFPGKIFIAQKSTKSSFHLESSKNDASITELYPR